MLEKDLILKKALDLAKYAAEGSQWADQFTGTNVPCVPIKQVNYSANKKAKPINSKITANNGRKCYRCGSNKHLANDKNCPASKITCNNYKKLGHYSKYCLLKDTTKTVNKPNVSVKNISSKDVIDSTKDFADTMQILQTKCYSVHSSFVNNEDHNYLNVKVNDVNIKFIVDTGSQATLIPQFLFKKMNTALKPASAVLADYHGEIITTLGECEVQVTKNADNFTALAFVTLNGNHALLGKSWISRMQHVDWNTLLLDSHPSLPCNNVSSSSNVDHLIDEYKDVFEDNPKHKVRNKLAHLVLRDEATPKFLPSRNVPLAIKPLVETEINRMVEMGFWTPVTESEWATPLVPVVKADGGIRLCGDYKVTVNSQFEVAHHPLPTNEELFITLSGSKVYSKIDLCHAFNQLEMDEKSANLCTVNTTKGLFKVNRLPYGIASSSALWQRTVDSVLNHHEGVICFVDDILISAPDQVTHDHRLRKVLDTLRQYNMHIKLSKCALSVDSVSYLGVKIDALGIHKTDDKIKAIKNAKVPTSSADVKSFMGLVTFYARFVPSLATIAAPLYQLTKKDVPFHWSEKCSNAFNELKSELCSNRVLTCYKPDLPLKLVCDASSVGVGAVLAHVFSSGEE